MGALGALAGPSPVVPSKDPKTGKRLHGGAIRKRAAEKARLTALPQAETALTLPVPDVFADVEEPPAGVAAIEAWAAGLNLRAAVAAEAEDAPRVGFVAGVCRELGRLSVKAARSEKAMKLRRLRLGEDDILDPDVPPVSDPVAAVAWAYAQLARLAHEAATSPAWRPDPRKVAAAKALAGAGFLSCNAELRAVAERVKKAK